MGIAMPESISRQDLESLAREAFIYGFSLVESMGKTYTMGTFPNVPMGAPANTSGHARQLVDAKTGRRLGIVSPNNDTLYSISQVDVGKEPLVFHVPATGDRYYVMQFVDAWSNNFAYVGTRATGSGRSIPPHSPHVHAEAGGIRREPVIPAADPASGVTEW